MLDSLPKKVRIIEVGPRDGLQNEKLALDLETKTHFINLLVEAGFDSIEATSFVRPDKIPQMGDAKLLFKELVSNKLLNKARLMCLVPNMKGMDNAISVGVKDIAVFTATSETFNKNNINATIDESFSRIEEVMKVATSNNINIRGYISTVFGCPYEGDTSIDVLKKQCERLFNLGAFEVSLGDTIGSANPLQVIKISNELKKDFDIDKICLHFHDSRGTALSNILVGLNEGFTNFDSSAGGLGGCPYALGATGNVATEDVVNLMESMGISTGIDINKLSEASNYILQKLNRASSSKYLLAYLAGKGGK
ncbi:MAG: hydroxymethylglutaryl-CoA lyase [Bacteriovoracaceae bacterium]|nr:hydroxymethylglutaryl-CoA lyase [Bacteriovoracaceae bacterium]